MSNCGYCKQPFDAPGWHDCILAQNAKRRLDELIETIDRQMRQPHWRPETSAEVKAKADQQRSIATTIKFQGGEVKEDWL